jgi:hypothetical protein
MSEAIFKCGARLVVKKIDNTNFGLPQIAIKFEGAESVIFYSVDGALHPEHDSPFDIVNIKELSI